MLQAQMTAAPAALDSLADLIKGGNLNCRRRDAQSDGDVRYWNVDPSQHPLLAEFKSKGEELYARTTGHAPAHAFIMINDIEAGRSPEGSGGGWHLDSYKPQYKFFMYVSDVESDDMGAFAYFPQTHSWWFRPYALAKRALLRHVRYTNGEIDFLRSLGVGYTSVKGPKGTNFFLDTSYLHRGLPIRKGRRLMATLYIYDELTQEMRATMGIA